MLSLDENPTVDSGTVVCRAGGVRSTRDRASHSIAFTHSGRNYSRSDGDHLSTSADGGGDADTHRASDIKQAIKHHRNVVVLLTGRQMDCRRNEGGAT